MTIKSMLLPSSAAPYADFFIANQVALTATKIKPKLPRKIHKKLKGINQLSINTLFSSIY